LRELEDYRVLVFGALLVVMMIVRPQGLWPASRPQLERPRPGEEALEEAPAELVEGEVGS
jgi:branched-chain amino acid transport system permease protein